MRMIACHLSFQITNVLSRGALGLFELLKVTEKLLNHYPKMLAYANACCC